MPKPKIDRSKNLLDLGPLGDASRVNNTDKQAIEDAGGSLLDDAGVVFVRDPHMIVPSVWGSATMFGERMKREVIFQRDEAYREAVTYGDYDAGWGSEDAAGDALEKAKRARVTVKMIKGRGGEYGLKYTLGAGGSSRQLRAAVVKLAHERPELRAELLAVLRRD